MSGEAITLDPATGRILWAEPMPTGAITVSVGDGLVLLRSCSPDAVIAREVATGDVRWEAVAPCGTAMSTLGGIVAVLTHSQVVGLDLATGAERWRTELAEAMDTSLVGTSELVMAIAGPSVVALDRSTGSVLWRSAELAGPMTLALAGPSVVVGGAGGLVTLDLSTGGERWRRTISPDGALDARATTSVLVTETEGRVSTLQFTSVPGHPGPTALPSTPAEEVRGTIIALDPATGEERWRRSRDGAIGGLAIVGSALGDEASGTTVVQWSSVDPAAPGRWMEGLDRRGDVRWSAPSLVGVAVADGVVLAVEDLARPGAPIVGLDADTGQQLWSTAGPAGGVVSTAAGIGAVVLMASPE